MIHTKTIYPTITNQGTGNPPATQVGYFAYSQGVPQSNSFVPPYNPTSYMLVTLPAFSQGVRSVQEITLSTTEINQRRRVFFLQLKDKIALELHIENRISIVSEGPRNFNKDGSTATAAALGSSLCCIFSMFTCTCICAEIAMKKTADRHEGQEIDIGIRQFASRLALGLIYQFQDQIPLITPEGLETLLKHFRKFAYDYTLYRKDRYGGPQTTYGILMHSYSHYRDLYLSSDNKPVLQTYYGFGIRIDQLFSTGVRTAKGNVYEPAGKYAQMFQALKTSGFPSYRIGTKDLEKHLKAAGTHWSRIDLKLTVDNGDSDGEEQFWQRAEQLAKEFLMPAEFTELEQLWLAK